MLNCSIFLGPLKVIKTSHFNRLLPSSEVVHCFGIFLTEAAILMSSMAVRAYLESFQSRPADLIDAVAHQRYKWQLKLLHSVGFSDWNPTRQSSMSLLHAAAYYNDIPMLLFGMGAIGIDPNTGDNYMTPLHEASMGNSVLAGSILREARADINSGHGVWGGTPLQRCMDFKSYEMGHWLLQCGANTNISDSLSNDVWTGFWERMMTRVVGRNHDVCFDFLREEAMLTHLLLHDSNPHQLFRTAWIQHLDHGIGFFKSWYDYCGHIQTPEVARACSYRIRGLLFYPSGSDENGSALCGFPKETIIQYEDAEHTRTPARTSFWCSRGHIYLAETDTPNDVGSDRDSDSDDSLESSDDDTDSGSEDGDCDCRKQHRSYNDRDSGSSLCNCDVDGGDNQNVRPGITLFYDTISTPEGQLRMSRFPFVCLLTNALCMAGYRAEMDEDGDIWYEDEDGDSYHDAREFQPHEDEDDGLARNCPMCQNPEKYGLGHIFEEAERGRSLLLEYRVRAKTQKRTYF
ncbi:hypothetical protein QC763_607400 [Podospora pseudopauciseta]|uniref:Ankyrin n=1 Tax=Podospora pseudopauciseta TaxID=2093780 RepID=A0ABR0H5M9_9PEZI|nr:hypothetical protein QC763_607400 [Podospora pseudopauciseta]